MENLVDESAPLASGPAAHSTSGARRPRTRPNLTLKISSPNRLRSKPTFFHTPIQGFYRLASVVIAVPRPCSPKSKAKFRAIHPTTPIHFQFPAEHSSVSSDEEEESVSENPFATPPRGAARLALAALSEPADIDGDVVMNFDLSPTGSMRRRRSQKKALQMLGNEAVCEVAKMRKLVF